ncbi:MAG: BatD family protein [Bacteroidales bacterium]|nr:BatD family protein [Bacteroidales bacterium]
MLQKYTKQILLIIIQLFATSFIFADEKVEFNAQVNRKDVVVGDPFQLSYVLNQKANDVRLAELEHFEILAGPSISQSRSVQFINGHQTSSFSYTVTYVLRAKTVGKHTIPAATATIDGASYKSNALTINVLPQEEGSKGQNNAQPQAQVANSQQITADNLFLLAQVSKTNVREQEALMLTYKLFYKVDVISIDNVKFPDLKGFTTQEVDVDDSRRNGVEHYNGKNYNTSILKQMVVFPQKSGKLTIEPMKLTAAVRVQVGQQRSFFGIVPVFNEVEKALSSKALTINVQALPNPEPADFCNGVGKLSMTTEIDKLELSANEPVTIKVTLKGTGNLKMIENPVIDFPADFEVYEPTVRQDYRTSGEGMVGSKTIEYLAIPRHPGEFKIPGFSLSYFDLASDSYKQLTCDGFQLTVNKGTGTTSEESVNYSNNQEQVKTIATDIRYINTDNLKLSPRKSLWVGSFSYWLAYLVPLILAVALLIFFRKQARENANVAHVKSKKANKVAVKRLKTADALMKEGKKNEFYDEILKALWGYLCDKLSIPTSALSKENVAQELTSNGVTTEMADEFIALLNACEYERYAPMQNSHDAMSNIYNNSIQMISRLEDTIVRTNK